jgi:hypothetical protein
MIDPNSKAGLEWSNTQRALADKCKALHLVIAEQQTRRAEVVAGEAQKRADLARIKMTNLLEGLRDRGPRVWREIVALDKPALIDWLIQDRLARLDAEIARLEQELAESQPSPYWQPGKE